jgi:hypothetical protein
MQLANASGVEILTAKIYRCNLANNTGGEVEENGLNQSLI